MTAARLAAYPDLTAAHEERERTVSGMVEIDVAATPTGPGVYRFVDQDGQDLYIGKAKNLRRRLANYAQGRVDPRISRMLAVAADCAFTLCASEQEALLLEREWIARSQPPFNIRMRHGSGYAGVALTKEETPRLHSWRGDRPSGVVAYGPYPGASGRRMVESLAAAFGVRTCSSKEYARASEAGRPCLLGETGRCLAPCLGGNRVVQHADAVGQLAGFLSGKTSATMDALRATMEELATNENFEAAARVRDRLQALETVSQRQTVVSSTPVNATAVVLNRGIMDLVAAVCTARNGVVVSVETFRSVNDPGLSDEECVTAGLDSLSRYIPESDSVIGRYADARVRPPRGEGERSLLSFTERQTEEAARQAVLTPWKGVHERMEAVGALQRELALPRLPRRIEGVDVSHLNGKHARAQLVALLDGYPYRSDYRTLSATKARGDDYAAIRDLLVERFSGSSLGLTIHPDLLVIDGGQPQVEAARAALEELEVVIPLVGLAKRMEEVWTPGSDEPLVLSRGSSALRLLMLVRDAAHDASVRRHRALRNRNSVDVVAQSVTGIGPRRRAQLIAAFGTWDAVHLASLGDLQSVLGPRVGERLHARLHSPDTSP